MVTKSLCASHHCMLISQAESAAINFRQLTARKLNSCTYLSARTGCLPKSVDKEDRQEGVPDVVTPLNSDSSWVYHYQVAQILDRHKVQRIAAERWPLAASVCLAVSASAPYRCLIDSRHVNAIPQHVCCSTARMRQQLQQKLVKSRLWRVFGYMV